ncbi:MAG: Arc family DNA binding domain-containing protein [Bacteroidetes bacterium]|nr:Arc family DNA binding domain-containing protein [Bacteroidota bacterium]
MSKKSFVLRIDEETFKAIEKWAADEFRSANGQIEWILDKALKDAGRKKGDKKPTTDKKA